MSDEGRISDDLGSEGVGSIDEEELDLDEEEKDVEIINETENNNIYKDKKK